MSVIPHKTITLKRWEDIRRYDRHEWLFRGQACADWGLSTSVERCFQRRSVVSSHWYALESRLRREFRRAYHEYGQHIPGPGSTIEWLSLMQHYGAPTRLLDFSYSIYIAAYFALESAECDCAVWAIDSRWALRQSVDLLCAARKSEDAVQKLAAPFEEGKDEGDVAGLFFGVPPVCVASPLNPFRLNQRLRAQRGVFMVPGDISQPFMTNLEALGTSATSNLVLKIIIPVAMVLPALKCLFSMGISRTSLFPGLDGFSQSLGVYHPTYSLVRDEAS